MSLLSRLLKLCADPHETVRPLWHRVVEIAREPEWYAQLGVADTVAGRFDMITAILCVVLLRMEGEPELVGPSVRLTELFVKDMDGQLRESGVGDVVVGKHVGRLMSVLGGRLGSYRGALGRDNSALVETVRRNVSMAEDGTAERIAGALVAFADKLSGARAETILAGNIER